MDENEQNAAETETPDEQAIAGDTGASAEDAHRVGEFDFLRDRMDHIESMLSDVIEGIAELRTNAASLAVDNGAYVADVDGDGAADVIEDNATVVIPDYEDLDLDL